MRIVLANRYFHPDQSATGRMVSSLAFALAREGFEVIALASRHFHDRRDASLPARESVGGVEVHRLRTSRFGRKNTLGRAVDYATFHLSAAMWWLANARRGDICVVCTDPPFLSVTSAIPIALRRAKMVNWVMDLFPETAIELGMMAHGRLPARVTSALRDWSLERAALTVCPIPAMAAYLSGRGISTDRFAVARHWSDSGEIRPVQPAMNALRREWGLDESFVVGYSGNFGRAHEFATLLDAAERLVANSKIRFLMIGEGQQRERVEREARRRGLTNMIFKPFQPVSRLSESLGAADVHVVSLLPRLEHCIVPSKFYGVLAAGRPTIFIGDRNGEVASVSRDAGCGETVAPGDAAALADLVVRLQTSPELCAAMRAGAERLMQTEYGLAHGVAAWRRAVTPLLPAEDALGSGEVAGEIAR